MKMQVACGCNCVFTQEVKYSKRGYAYVICPGCSCCVGLNHKKGQKKPYIRAFTGYNVEELSKDLR